MSRFFESRFFVYMRQLFADAVSIIGWPVRRLLPLKDIDPHNDRPNSSIECQPIRTLDELLAIDRHPIAWHSLVTPLDLSVRCGSRALGPNFESFDTEVLVAVEHSKEAADAPDRPRMLVCHDLAGNYRGDRFVHGSIKWDDYRFYHWSGIDDFCYFSHQFVTVPPLGWLQAAHRHGCRVLGTIITESADGARTLRSILRDDATVSATVDALVHLAAHLHFEGWLLNVECELPVDLVPRLLRFVEQLHTRMHERVPHATVLWYDSILLSGKLSWQNELNARNRPFFDACDGILLNYNWTDGSLDRTRDLLGGDRAAMSRVHVGIDVFGRGQVAKLRTAETLARIRAAGPYSVGVFAPGWTFESNQELGVNIHTRSGTDVCNAHFVELNHRFWSQLWPMLETTGPARLPFRTTFCMGSGKQRHRDGLLSHPAKTWFDLRAQSWQPSVPVGGGGGAWQPHFEEAYTGGTCLRVEPSDAGTVRRLFVCDFGGDDVYDGLVVGYAFKAAEKGADVAVWLRAVDGACRQVRIECGQEPGTEAAGATSRASESCIRLEPLAGEELQTVLVHLAERRECCLSSASRTGWQVRYYVVAFVGDLRASVRVRDIGVAATGNSVYLGALHVLRGVAGYADGVWRQQRRAISATDFS